LPVAVATEPVAHDADDPAIWVHPSFPEGSLILGTDKTAAPDGALVVFGLDGRQRQRIDGLDRPNNVDVEYGLKLGGEPIDVAVLTERYRRWLRVFSIPADGGALEDVTAPGAITVFEDEVGERAAPMGIGLYKRPADGVVFAIVSRKAGPERGYLWQYRLEDDGTGRVRAAKVRELGDVLADAEVEAVAVDDARGFVYYAEEGRGLHKWLADPDQPRADRELALFGSQGFEGDREGLALYSPRQGRSFLIACDQRVGNSRYLVFAREDPGALPEAVPQLLTTLEGGADETDGLDASAEALGPAFPRGLLVAMNSRGRNFLVYRWDDLGLE
jgi:3-phytase